MQTWEKPFYALYYEVMPIEGKDAGHMYAHITTVQFVFNSS